LVFDLLVCHQDVLRPGLGCPLVVLDDQSIELVVDVLHLCAGEAVPLKASMICPVASRGRRFAQLLAVVAELNGERKGPTEMSL
jgi:hypothetical protein